MKTLFVVAGIASLVMGQVAGDRIEGAWVAEFQGRTFVRLELESVAGATAGGLSIGNFEVDAQGEVARADDAPQNLSPIFDLTLRGSDLRFSRKDRNDTDQFVLHLLDSGRAELQMILNDEDREELAAIGLPVPKPIRLTRAR